MQMLQILLALSVLIVLPVSAQETRLHPVRAYCATYEVGGMSKGTFITCQRAWGRERFEQWNTSTGIGPFRKQDDKHVIFLGEHIYTKQKNKVLRTVNPIYEQLMSRLQGTRVEDLQEAFMKAMQYTPTGEQRTVNDVACTVSRSPLAGNVCLTDHGILVEQRVMGQSQRLLALEIGEEGENSLYDPQAWSLPIEDGPDVGKVLDDLKGLIPERR